MHMCFWLGLNIENFLFQGFDIDSVATLIGTCLVLFLLGIGMEWLGLVQAKIRHIELVEKRKQLRRICNTESDSNDQEPSTSAQQTQEAYHNRKKKSFLKFLIDVSLWISQQCIGYILMLSVMIYNVYLVISIVCGYALGYFVFGQAAIKIKLKNCQVKRDTFCMTDCGDPDKAALIRPDSPREQTDGPTCHSSSPGTSAVIIES